MNCCTQKLFNPGLVAFKKKLCSPTVKNFGMGKVNNGEIKR